MFKLVDNEEIGQYLSKIIDDKYASKRKFCQAYLMTIGTEPNNDETRKMANRLTQILKGVKAIQTYDLPIFTKLLDASCEEILSAGKTFVRKEDRLTNYSVAFSKDKNLWKEYINHEDKLILNPDEYCNTVLDYAIKFKNFDFIKYLIDQKYIWFDCAEDNSFVYNFGAGTSIKGRNIGDVDYYLPNQLCNDKLRINLIALAAQNNSLEILKALRAREIPDYYNAIYFSGCQIDIKKYYEKDLIVSISTASNDIVDYFTNVFEIGDLIKYKDGIIRKHKFMFPFISEVLDELIKNDHGFVEAALRKSIEHNRETYNKLKELLNEIIETGIVRYDVETDEYFHNLKKDYMKKILDEIDFNENKSIIAIRGNSTTRGLITNIVQVKNESKNVNYLSKELNALYEKIVHIRNEFEL